MRALRTDVALVMLALMTAPSSGHAEESKDVRAEARTDFLRGTALVRDAHWAEALDAFERAGVKSPHPITTYNVGTCERALGRYTRARRAFRAALAVHAEAGGLPASLVDDARAFIGEIDHLLATLRLHVSIAGARVSVDGRPLAATGEPARVYEAGVAAAGSGEPLPGRDQDVVLDPGAHLVVVESTGHSTVLVRRVLAPASVEDVKIELELLPSTIDVSASAAGSTVTIDGARAGTTPIRVTRAPGPHRVTVSKPGFVDYDTWVTSKPGEQTTLRATLAEQHTPVTKQWWFWTAAGVVVAGAATGTYFATRAPESAAPPNGGSLGWNVTVD